jgi:pimeloyl-ACP methyl ester carboxylesterase
MVPSEGFLVLGDDRLFYRVVGDCEPLVLVHAGIADQRMWEEQIAGLSPDYRVIAYDVRGFGQSKPSTADHYVHEDLRALLDHLGVERTMLVGMSMGSGVVMDFSVAYPERTKAIVLSGAGYDHLDWSRLQEGWTAESEAVEAGDIARAVEINLGMWVVGIGRAVADLDIGVVARAREMIEGTLKPPENTGEALEPDPVSADRLGDVEVPALVLVGSFDQPEMIESAKEISSRIPHAKLVEMEGVAHLPNMERPEEFNRIVLEFLGQT